MAVHSLQSSVTKITSGFWNYCRTRLTQDLPGKSSPFRVIILKAELAGESAVKLWREHRGLTQQDLANRAGISKPYLSQIETGKRQGRVETLSAIARALDIPIDVLTD